MRQLDLDVIVVARRDVDEKHASLLALLSGAAVRIGFSSRNIPSKHLDFVKDRYFTNLVDFPTERILRESDAILRASSFFAAPKTFSRTKLKIQSKALENADNILARSDRTKVAVALGANSGRRRWPIKNFVASIEELNSHFDLDFILIGSKADKCAAQQLENDTTARVTNCCGITDLQTSAAIISRCRLTLCNDSGPLHISEAVGTPVVSISCHPKGGNDYHANSPKRFGPALPESICHQPPTHLSPCRNGCKSLVAHCICLVTPETVTQSASEILARTVNSEQWQDD
ncbi:MAG: glycosyltransferase family 9 protein [Aureliella sp.]